MSSIESLIAGINSLRDDHIRSSIATPREKTEFEFGRINGYNEAIDDVLELINKILEEDDPDDQINRSSFGRPLIGQ